MNEIEAILTRHQRSDNATWIAQGDSGTSGGHCRSDGLPWPCDAAIAATIARAALSVAPSAKQPVKESTCPDCFHPKTIHSHS